MASGGIDRQFAWMSGEGPLSGLEEFADLRHEIARSFIVCVFWMLDTDGDAVITRAEYDRPLAGIVARLDRNGDGGLSLRDGRHDRHDEDQWDDD